MLMFIEKSLYTNIQCLSKKVYIQIYSSFLLENFDLYSFIVFGHFGFLTM
jgi:hypothetical protein